MKRSACGLPLGRAAAPVRAIGLVPDNIEATSLGKAKDGTDVFILGSDNNFSAAQKTQFYAFKILRRPQQ
ncbi:hypothetical protein CO654_25380 [Rhizobium sp. L18]|jgi:hypothetical protein|nr:hypothetical protein [Rhizobium sp. BK456]PDS82314.1 hypothetical protein CO654_25380 [Rhizobium sp. L18]